MAHVTFIARSLDGLLLVESWDDANRLSGHLKQQAKQLLKKMRDMPPRCSIEGCGAEFLFHYIIHDGICYLALFDKGYPKNLAFAFLEEIHKAFQEELKREFGTGSVDYRSHIETIEKAYYFIKFDRVINKKKQEYRDPQSSKALGKLNENLIEVSNIMRQNIDEILHRGEALESIGKKGDELKGASKQFAGMTRMLKIQTLVQQYGVPIVIMLVIFMIIFFKFFVFSSKKSS